LSTHGTLYVLCVNCSILAFTEPSQTSQIPDLMIQRIFDNIFAILTITVIWFGSSGIFGAGGRIGSFNFT
jgi:hypothetical protein